MHCGGHAVALVVYTVCSAVLLELRDRRVPLICCVLCVLLQSAMGCPLYIFMLRVRCLPPAYTRLRSCCE